MHKKNDMLPAQAFPQILKKVPEGLQTAGLEQRRFGGQVEKTSAQVIKPKITIEIPDPPLGNTCSKDSFFASCHVTSCQSVGTFPT